VRAKEICTLLKAQCTSFEVKNPWDIVRLSRALGFTPESGTNYVTMRIPAAPPQNNGPRCSEALSIQHWLQSQVYDVKDQEDVSIDVEGNSSPDPKGIT
jgi:hypothetical protein